MNINLTEREMIVLGMFINYGQANLDDLHESYIDPNAKTCDDLTYNGIGVFSISPVEIEVLLRKLRQL